jgi:hypothetical protein
MDELLDRLDQIERKIPQIRNKVARTRSYENAQKH